MTLSPIEHAAAYWIALYRFFAAQIERLPEFPFPSLGEEEIP